MPSEERTLTRTALIRNSADEFIKSPAFSGLAILDNNKLSQAINEYYIELPKTKEKYGINDRADRHKVAALTTLVLNKHKPIQVKYKEQQFNAFLKLANILFAIHAGFSDIDRPSLIPDKDLAALISQLQEGEVKLLSLSHIYCKLEQEIQTKRKDLSL